MIKPRHPLALLLFGLACATSSQPAGPSPVSDASVREVKDAELAVDVSKPPYRPHLTSDLNVAGNVVWGEFRVCADPEGEVYDVGPQGPVGFPGPSGEQGSPEYRGRQACKA